MSDNLASTGGEAAERLKVLFATYLEVNKHDTVELTEHQGANLGKYLYQNTPRAKAEVIKAKLDGLGYQFIRAPKSYAAKVGKNASGSFVSDEDKPRIEKQRVTLADLLDRKHIVKANIRGLARGTSSKRAKALRKERKEIDAKLGKERMHLTISEQRYAAYNARVGRIGATAASWIQAMLRLGTKGVRITPRLAKKGNALQYSNAVFLGNGENLNILITNSAPGIADLDDATGFVDLALLATGDDIQRYLDRKADEYANRWRSR